MLLTGALLLSGCVSGDFGRLRDDMTTDSVHAWVGAVATNGGPVSQYPLTDDERLLRDLAYPLIEPPYDRYRWYTFINEYGLERVFHKNWWAFDRSAYSVRLLSSYYRSASARYAQLGDDINNDILRTGPFFLLARRILDMDEKRQKSMGFMVLSPSEVANAQARIAENRCVIQWVHWSLTERMASYRFALERLLVAEPYPAALDLERALTQMNQTLDQYNILPPIAVEGSVAQAEPFPGPRVAAIGR